MNRRSGAMDAKVALWREVEAGTRFTEKTARERYPQLTKRSFDGLPSEVARRPKIGKSSPRDVKTYLASDVDALAARVAAAETEPVDPRWREVEAGTRHTVKTAMDLYPQLNTRSFEGLPSEVARRTKPCKGPREVQTYLASD